MTRSDDGKRPSNALQSTLAEGREALLLLAGLSFFINLLILTSPLYMLQMFDRVLSSGRVETLLYLTLIAGIAVLVMGALDGVRGRVLGRIGRWFERRLAPELIRASVRARLRGANLEAQPLRDLASIKGFIGGPGITALLDAPWAPAFLLVIWLLHPMLGLIALVAAGLLFATAVLNEYLSRAPLMQAGQLSVQGLQQAGSAIRNADVMHAMGLLPGFVGRWTGQNERALALQLLASDRSAALLGFSKFFRIFAQIGVLGAGAYLVLGGELTPGGMIAASILLGRALAPVEQAIGSWRGFVAAREAYGRLGELLGQVPAAEAQMALPAPNGRIDCEKVIFVPPGREAPVLKAVSFALEPGDGLGIIGPSGAGKSTLCKILIGSWPATRGSVRIDGAELAQWLPEQLGASLGYLPQDVELFSGTVKDNIARLAADPDADDVVQAAKIAGAHDMILRLVNGYETEIGEGGSALSGGERQRIGLARALYGEPRLVVLDEPNASLDAEGEHALLAAIEKARGWGATVIVVAHQPRILRPLNKALLLRDGAVGLFGPREEVLGKVSPVRLAAAG